MRRWILAALALAACAGGAEASATKTRTEYGARPLSAFWIYASADSNAAGDTLAGRGLLAVAAAADTVGPVWIGDALRTHAWVAGIGSATSTDSLAITGETSVDKVNWVAVTGMAATSAGSSTYAILFSRILETTTANEAAGVKLTTTGTNHGIGRWFRMRLANNNVNGIFTKLSAGIEVAR